MVLLQVPSRAEYPYILCMYKPHVLRTDSYVIHNFIRMEIGDANYLFALACDSAAQLFGLDAYFIVSNVVTSHFLNGSTPTCQPVLFSELLSGAY